MGLIAPATAPRAPAAPPTPAASNTIACIFGRKGMGKTTLLRRVWLSSVQRGGCGTFVDPAGQASDLVALAAAAGADALLVRSPRAWWAHVRSSRRAGRRWAVVVQPGWGVQLGPLWEMLHLIGGSLLAIDEAERWANVNAIDAELGELVSLGRPRQVSIAAAVRLPPELHYRFRGNADQVISFRQEAKRYADVVAGEMMHRPELAARLLRLPRGVFLRLADDTVTVGRV